MTSPYTTLAANAPPVSICDKSDRATRMGCLTSTHSPESTARSSARRSTRPTATVPPAEIQPWRLAVRRVSGARVYRCRSMKWVSATTGCSTIARRRSFGRSGQIIAPSGRRDLLPLDKLPFDLETLALGGVHGRLPPDMHPCASMTVQTAGGERQGDGEQAQRECPDQRRSHVLFSVSRGRTRCDAEPRVCAAEQGCFDCRPDGDGRPRCRQILAPTHRTKRCSCRNRASRASLR